MKFRLILALICLLLIIQTVSAETENRVTNGDFETGDLTGWTKTGDGSVWVGSDYAHNGTYGCKIVAGGSGDWSGIKQDVDLTGVDKLTFWYWSDGTTSDARFKLLIDGSEEWSIYGDYDWTYVEIGVSGYEGTHTIEFRVISGPNQGEGIVVYLDDVAAEAEIEVKNVTFLFYEVVNQQYLINVTLDYSLDGEDYTAVFSSGDNITVPSGTNLTIYNAHKFGFQSEYEAGQSPESWTITNDTTITVTFSPALIEYKNIYFYFRDSETGSLLKGVQFKADVYYEGENVLSIDAIYDYYKVITAPNGSTIYVYKAHKEGYTSDIDEQGTKSYTVTDSAEYTIKFYPAATHGEVVFRFFDAKTDALLDSVQFSISGEDFSDSGVYDYTVSYDDTQLKVGYTYSYTASRDGYQSVSGSFTFQGGQTIDLYLIPIIQDTYDDEMEDPVNNTVVTFTVVDAYTGEPLVPLVTLEGYSKLTNSNGFTWFEVQKNGTYRYRVSKEGYYSISRTINVGENQTDVTVELIPVSSIPTTTTTPAGGGDTGTGGGTESGTIPSFPSSGSDEDLINTLRSWGMYIVYYSLLIAFLNIFGMVKLPNFGRRRRR